MSRGRRYETEGKLNYQKVFAVIIAIIVIAMVVMIIKNVFIQREKLNKEYEYFTAFSADKWGVINQDGETVINPSYQEMIVIPDKTKDVFICTYDINEEDGTYKTKALNRKNEEIFTLNVSGESMINAGIYDNDIVIVKRRKTARNGDIVVALTEENETTLKRFYKENGHFRLQPENDTMDPIILDKVEILGIAIGLYRKF